MRATNAQRGRLLALAPALVLCVAYLIWAPPSADLAAQTFRADLFSERGFAVWSNAWYAGFHPLGYSFLFGPLAWLVGIRLAGALAVLAGAALFGALVRPRYGSRADLAIALFGVGMATNLYTGRLTFALGLAVGAGALVALDRGRPGLAALVAALSSLASPVAGLFVAFAGAVAFLTGRRRGGVLLAAPALATIAVPALLFPSGGYHPFSTDTFFLIGAATLILVVLLPGSEREIRIGAVAYIVFCLVWFAVETPVGGNATRLGALVAAPLLALGAWRVRPRWLVGLALVPLLYWQLVAPVRDLADAVGEPSTEEAYYEPLLAELDERLGDNPQNRVQVPPTRNRWEAVYVAGRFPLARGWLRQAESDDFELFRGGNLDAATYREWLDERAVGFVALSLGAKADYLSEDEIELVRGGLPYLDEVWSTSDWELYEVRDPVGFVPGAVSEAITEDEFAFDPLEPGDHLVRVRHTPYWEVTEGDACVSPAGDWTRVEVRSVGPVTVEARFSAQGAFAALRRSDSERCSE